MNAQDLKTMLDYHYWARDRVLDAVAPLTPEQVQPGSRQQLQVHPRYVDAHLCGGMGVVLTMAGCLAHGAAAGG